MRKLDRVPQTLGEKLRELRRGQAVSLDMLENATHIQRSYLVALEHGQYEQLPEPMYTRNFIRAYARYLGADEQYFIELYEDECGRCDLVQPMCTPRQRVRRSRFISMGRIVRSLGISAIVICIVTYLGWQIQGLTEAPEVMVLQPSQDLMTDDATLKVQGVVEGESTVYVNGNQITVDAQGAFSTFIDLDKGMNEIIIEAERRYSRRSEVTRRVIFDPMQTVQR